MNDAYRNPPSPPEYKLIAGSREDTTKRLNDAAKEGFRPIMMCPYGEYSVYVLMERSS